jgi:hypothetical protein
MEFAIKLAQSRWVGFELKSAEGAFCQVQGIGVVPAKCESQRFELKENPDFVSLAYFVGGRVGNERTFAGNNVEEAFGLQLIHRVADWNPTDAKTFGNFLLGKGLAGGELTAHDGQAQSVSNLISGAGKGSI